MRFDAIPTPEVTLVWDSVRPGIERIIRLCKEDFRPEDVYANLIAGRSTLFLLRESQTSGFAVLEVIGEHPKRKLNVWLLYLVNRTDEVREDLVAFLDECARKAGCRHIRFLSPRQGWERFLRGEFHKKAVIYERDVP